MKYLILLIASFLVLELNAQHENSDKTLSPYFLVKGAEAGVEALPLKRTTAQVNIAGVIADVLVNQTYVNTGTKPIEAIYVFPGSTQAAVYGLTMHVGNRRVVAKIEEREKARKQYEQAKSEGKRASLLEQERPNVFQMNVANIMPGDTIRVELSYTELLIPESGSYEFVYPTVVGPRYSNGKSKHNKGFTAQPYLESGILPDNFFEIQVHIAGGMPIGDVTSTSHRISVSTPNVAGVDVLLDASEQHSGNRDFILRYQLSGDQTEAGLLLFDDGEEKFFLCMAQPPKRITSKQIPAREYIFVLDVSGSMNGFPLDVAKKLMKDLIGGLRSTDRFNVILFAGVSCLLSEQSLLANSENLEKSFAFIDAPEGGGGTELLPALERALKLPRADQSVSRTVTVVTDGYIDVEAECFDLIRKNLGNANLFAFGIGSSVNRHLIEGMAHVGAGEPFVVTNEKEAASVAKKFRKYISNPAFSRVNVKYKGFQAYDVEPSTTPDVLSERPVVLIGKWRGEPTGEIVIQGYQGKEKRTLRVPVHATASDPRNAAIKYLWARERIKLLSDYNIVGADPNRDKAVTKLGLKYHLLTAFTSFIAIDEVRNSNGELVTVKQPLPLPQGVSNLAVGFDLGISGISGVPERHSGAPLMILGIVGLAILVFLAFRFRRRLVLIPFLALIFLASCRQALPVETCEGDTAVFLMGEDRSSQNPYFDIAKTYFEQDSLEKTDFQLTDFRDLESVCNYLAGHKPAGGFWKRIHLVVHGNQWTGVRMAATEGAEDRTSADMINQAWTENLLPKIPTTHVNEQTRIIIESCNVGNDSALLKALSHVFNQAPVLASKYFNVFERVPGRENSVKKYMADYRYLVFPAGSYPGNKAIAEAFKRKYPEDTLHWGQALQRLMPIAPGASYVHYFNIPVQWISVCESSPRPLIQSQDACLKWVYQEPELLQRLHGMGMTPEEFRWEIAALDYQVDGKSYPAFKAEGRAIIYCIMCPLDSPEFQLDMKQYAPRYYKQYKA
ncbi:MAG: VWA domain-containing protein [Saprospiraceae bacterium]|nr:VWA domain-containing protein [Saprospiraceae bacterium]